MEYNESNFIYLKKTNMEKYYDELVKAEYICEHFPLITKIIVRKVIEGFLKDIAEKYNIQSNLSARNLLNYIKFGSSFSLPEEIYKFIEIILVNGYEYVICNNRNKIVSKHPIEILEMSHNILCWYLKKTEPEIAIATKNLNFRAPSTIEYKQKEINKIKEDILLKDNQINNLRQKVIELGSQSKNVHELNKIIIAIKEEKSELENIKILLTKKIEIQNKQVYDIETNYKTYTKKINKLKERYIESQELLLEKESQLVNAEIQKKALKELFKELHEWDETIKRMEQSLEEELKNMRQAYENSLNLTNQYQDALETMEFSCNMELQKVLEVQKNNIKIDINFQDRIFNENITNYTKDIAEAKRKAIIFKQMLNEKIKREIQYEPFYKGLLRLGSKELRIIYTIVNNINTKSNLISKSKELLKSNDDKLMRLINKGIEELKDVSNDEIRLMLYYGLIKLSNISMKNIYNRKSFVQALDEIVDKAYEILISKKDFKDSLRKLDSISIYYLKKVIYNLKNENIKFQISEELAGKIYTSIMNSNQSLGSIDKEKIFYDKFKLKDVSETELKSSIKVQPFDFLSILVELRGIRSYKDTSNIILKFVNLIRKKSVFNEYEQENFTENYYNEYFMILLFLYSGVEFFNQKQQEELLSLVVMGIMSMDLVSDNDAVNLDSYNRMVSLWKIKQQKYNDIFLKKEDMENKLQILISDKKELEIECENLLRNYHILSGRYSNYKEEFKKIVMNSEKKILLSSYTNYESLLSRKESAESNINSSKNKIGTLKSIFSPKVWKEQASKLINESNMIEAEKLLIEEAKEKLYFKKEYSVFLDLEEQIKEINKLIDKNKENIKNKNMLIDNMNIKINDLQSQLNHIKDLYLDIEEGYY